MQTPKDAVSRSRVFAKLAVIAAIVAVIRYFLKGWLAPLGVPTVVGSFLAPITIVMLAGMVLVFLSEGRRSDGRYWKAAASFAGFAIWCEALIIGGILLTERTGKDTYYSGPWDMVHEMFPDQTAHVIGHAQGIVFVIVVGSVIGAVIYFLSKRRSTETLSPPA